MWPIVHFDCDGAAANWRMLEVYFDRSPGHWLCSARHCENHSNNLVEGAVAVAVDEPCVNKMYSVALLFRMHGYFARLQSGIKPYVESLPAFSFRRGQPPTGAKEYANECQDYFVRNYKRVVLKRRRGEVVDEGAPLSDDEAAAGNSAADGRQTSQTQHQVSKQLLQAWAEFRTVFNGPWWVAPCHYCVDAHCCDGFNKAVTKTKMIAAMRRLLFQSLPTVPVKSKWLQTGACTDFFCLVVCLMNILPSLWPVALGALNVKTTVGPNETWEQVRKCWSCGRTTGITGYGHKGHRGTTCIEMGAIFLVSQHKFNIYGTGNRQYGHHASAQHFLLRAQRGWAT